MPPQDEPLRLDREDLFSPRVDAFLEEREALRRAVPDAPTQSLLVRIVYSSWFYLSIAGCMGSLLGWVILEPFFNDGDVAQPGIDLAGLLMFPAVAGGIGLFLGAAEGIMCRNPARAFQNAVVGLGVGFGGGLLSSFAANMLFGLMSTIALTIDPGAGVPPGRIPQGFAFLVLMMGRGAAWAVLAIPAGIGQGVALKERKVILNGLLGGLIGGLLGGLLFDPIYLAFTTDGEKATVSRGIGFGVIGLFVGLFVGLVELWTRTAWLYMKAGPLAGKQFVLHRNPTVLGSSPKADVYLFKDDAIEPRHALIHNRGGRFEIEDCDTPDGTYVNGIPVRRQVLQAGDQIVLGKTVLEFTLRDAK